ncbi:MAG: cell division protein SepF [Defluviitaleaceae bacterium]|nr:cell division protein SepF [Defluviitaleaceae bacterium]
MLSFFRGIGEKFRNMMLAPGAKDPYNTYYDDDDYDDYDDDDTYYQDDVDVHYTSRDRSRDRDYNYKEYKEREPASRAKTSRNSSRGSSLDPAKVDNVLGFNAAGKKESFRPAETIISHPMAVEDAIEIASHVRTGKLCIIDLTGLDAGEAQRIADYLGGVCQALDGATTRVNNGIFTVSPPNHRVIPAYGNSDTPYDDGIFTRRAAR